MMKLIFLVIALETVTLFSAAVNTKKNKFDLYYKTALFEVNPKYGNGSLKLYNQKYVNLTGINTKQINELFVSLYKNK